ncbi:MAG TPA: NADH-quinone oxidoreductase subunit C [Alphaproteobacteria bacterium]|nr:NADH-quinone oxidoreductase subunit C [Alphaproteobacteria bacterium]
MDEALRDLGEQIVAALPDAVTGYDVVYGELTLTAEAENILAVLNHLKDDSQCRFRQLVDITGVDHPGREKRFDVVYHLLSLHNNQRIRVKVMADETTPIPSATSVFSAAGWYERETWDLYGVMFSDHPDLRRILTDYGFEGFPLRKDFPLTGYVEVRYSEDLKRVVYEPVKLTQEFRTFDFMSPWEGAKYILPGDEKATEAPAEESGSKASGS